MPCESYPTADYDNSAPYKRRITSLTRDLCFLCGQLVDEGIFDSLASDRIKRWWKKHLESDTNRLSKKMNNYFKKNPDDTPTTAALVFVDKAEQLHPVSEFHRRLMYQIAKEQKIAASKEVKAAKARKIRNLKSKLEKLEGK